MLSNTTLFDLVSERFDPDAMRDAFLEKIEDRILYDELAESIVDEHEHMIDDLIAELAEDSLR